MVAVVTVVVTVAAIVVVTADREAIVDLGVDREADAVDAAVAEEDHGDREGRFR